jgi:hypothetical protein
MEDLLQSDAHDDTAGEPADAARRGFLQQVLTAGAVAAGAGLLAGCATAAPAAAGAAGAAPAPAGRQNGASGQWDMSWTRKLGRYRTAYESPEIMSGAALAFAAAAMEGYRQALGVTRDFTPVLILRHTASVMTLDDAMWARLALGEAHKLKDPTSGEPATRNPFINHKQGDKHSMTGAQAALDTLVGQGAVVLTCNRALMGVAYQLRRKETQLTQEAAMAEVRKSVLPGVYVMPNGIFAISAAQDAGCHYVRVLV